MDNHPLLSREELEQRLARAEGALEALRRGQIDTIAGEQGALVMRLAASETRERHIKQVLLAIRNVNQLMVFEDDPRRLIEKVCVTLTENIGYYNAWIALLERGSVTLTAACGFEGDAFLSMKEKLSAWQYTHCMTRAVATGGLVTVEDPKSACMDCPLSKEYGGRAGFSRCLHHEGKVYGVISVSVPLEYAHDAEEQSLFNEVANDLGFALHKIETAEALRLERERLDFIINGSRLGTWVWNVKTNETVFNEQWASMIGYRLEELMPYDYATWERLVHPDDLEAAVQKLSRCVSGELPDYESEFRMRHKDGRWVWVLDQGRVMRHDASGGPLWMFGTHMDITARKQTEEAVRSHEQYLQTILQTMADGLIVTSVRGAVLDANPAYCRLSGFAREELVSMSIGDLDALETPEEIAAHIRKVLEKGGDLFETRHRRKNGETWPVEISTVRLDIRGGRFVCFARDLTERRRSENALRIALAKYKTLFECFPLGISITDETGRILESNPASEKLLGISRQEQVGRTVDGLEWRIMGLDGVPMPAREFASVRAIRENRTVENVEMGVVRPDAGISWISVNAAPIELEGYGVVVTYGDITPRVHAETLLRASESRYRRAEAIGHVGNWEYDLETGRYWASEEARRIFWLSPDREFFSVDEVEMRLITPEVTPLSLMDAIEINNVYHAQFDIALQDAGERKTVEVFGELQRDNTGRAVRITGVVMDITARKKAEDALRISEAKYRLLFDNNADGILIANIKNGKFTAANKSICEMFGYSEAELLVRGVEDIHPPDHLPFILSRFMGKACSLKHRAENVPCLRKDGTLFYADINASPIEIDGEIYKVGMFRDITERKRAEARILENLKEKETLIREIHHRVKNNMAVISGLLALQSDKINDPELKAVLEDNRQRIRSMALIHEKLYQSKQFGQIDIKAYITGLVNDLMASYHLQHRAIETIFDLHDIRIDIDTAIPCGLIINELMTNALKYAFGNRETGEIRICFKRRGPDEGYILSIGDNGGGLPESLDPAGTDTLGLQLVHVLTRQLRGAITFLSNADGRPGTEVIITFKGKFEI